MDTKIWYQSKRFWGIVATAVGFTACTIAQYFGQDIASIVNAFGTMLQVFGIPFTAYGSIVATQPIGFKK